MQAVWPFALATMGTSQSIHLSSANCALSLITFLLHCHPWISEIDFVCLPLKPGIWGSIGCSVYVWGRSLRSNIGLLWQESVWHWHSCTNISLNVLPRSTCIHAHPAIGIFFHVIGISEDGTRPSTETFHNPHASINQSLLLDTQGLPSINQWCQGATDLGKTSSSP